MAKEITGKKVFLGFVGFFGLIFVVNAVMLWLAFSTWTGLDVESPYQFSQQYQNELDEVKQQNSLEWIVEVGTELNTTGLKIEVQARDKFGNEVTGYAVVVKLSRPTQSSDDIIIELVEKNSGFYTGGVANVLTGQWDLITDFIENDVRVFRSKNRVFLKVNSESGS